MILTMTPADELAALRTRIRALARREAQLRFALAEGHLPLSGMSARVEVIVETRTVFCPERLPGRILADPRYWRDEVTERVDVIARTPERTEAARPLLPLPDLTIN